MLDISKKDISLLAEKSVRLLADLISIPSISRDESAVADFLEKYMQENGLSPHRVGNNLFCCTEAGEDGILPPSDRPTLLLNAHIDTVKPAPGYSFDPFTPRFEDGKLYGLGSNDDGGSLVALLAAYQVLSSVPQPYRLVFSATAEEEVNGKDGFEAIFPYVGDIALAVIGEPTGMRMAVAERGLMVLDCVAYGKSGHAAREEGVNAIYKALTDIEWFRTYKFPEVSPFLGPVKMSVTVINAGTQHNVVPDKCSFVVDVRSNGLYSNKQILDIVKENVSCDVNARSVRLGSSSISMDSSVVRRGLELGLEPFGSPTTSNQAVSPFTTIKIGPGESSRSHTADEFIVVEEITSGIEIYCRLLDGLQL